MRDDFYVYMLLCNDGTPFYVGKGRGDRWLQHERKRTARTNPLLRGILKREGYCFPKMKMQENMTERDALALEVELIALFGRRCDGTGSLANLTLGGEGVSGIKWSAESRARASKSARARIFTPEQLAARSATQMAYWTAKRKETFAAAMRERWQDPKFRNGFTRSAHLTEQHKMAIKQAMSTEENRRKMSEAAGGRKHTDAAKAKMSARHKGRVLSTEHKIKLSVAKAGKSVWLKKGDKLSESHKAAISAGRKGKPNGWEGKRLSEEHRAKLSAARRAVIERKKAAGVPDLSGRGRRAKYEREMAERQA